MARQRKAKLKYSADTYNPRGLAELTEAEVRKEYSRLRAIAIKRLKRFEGTEWVESEVYQRNSETYLPIAHIKNRTMLQYKLSALARFINADTGSVSGLKRARKQTIETLHDRGYEFVNTKNFKRFTDLMDSYRSQNLNRMYDSKRVAELFVTAEQKGIEPSEVEAELEQWIQKADAIESIEPPPKNNLSNSEYYRKKLNIVDKKPY